MRTFSVKLGQKIPHFTPQVSAVLHGHYPKSYKISHLKLQPAGTFFRKSKKSLHHFHSTWQLGEVYIIFQ